MRANMSMFDEETIKEFQFIDKIIGEAVFVCS